MTSQAYLDVFSSDCGNSIRAVVDPSNAASHQSNSKPSRQQFEI